MSSAISTPFSVKTAESLTPAEVASQFVDHEAYRKLIPAGHTFIEGPRGSGKSMLFRYMSPATQSVVTKQDISKLPFIGIIVPVKQANVQMPEMKLLSGSAARLIAENLLVTMVAIQVCRAFDDVLNHVGSDDKLLIEWINVLYTHIQFHVSDAGYTPSATKVECEPAEKLKHCLFALANVERVTQDYLNSLVFCTELPNYGKRLLNYQFFLFPLFEALLAKNQNQNQTFYILVDDADWLREEQTRVLNTWVSFRTSNTVSFKAACQLDYKTFLTSGTRRIESPHDFSRVNLSTIYTQGSYEGWVKNVIEKRLSAFNISVSAEDFFVEDKKQKEKLLTIQREIQSTDWGGPSTDRKRDDAYRYARPELIRRLGGKSKQSSTFLYCGFNQLVDISNATIRFFLESASEMYALQQQKDSPNETHYISPSIQNSVVRNQATHMLQANFDEIVRDYAAGEDSKDLVQKVKQVKNLVDVIGSAFYASLISPTRSERRVLAFALQTEPSDELQEILRLAVSLNFFTVSSIGKKEGFGRTKRYVINRRIAPYYNLDPSGFSGYFWVTSELLLRASTDPAKGKDELRARLPTIMEGAQMTLSIDDLNTDTAFLEIQEVDDEKN